jgi:membrane-associated protease RseP (regulator of RpoE activity)
MFYSGWLSSALLVPLLMGTPRLDGDPQGEQYKPAHQAYARALHAQSAPLAGQQGQFRYQLGPEQFNQSLFTLVQPPVLGLTLQSVPEVLLAQLDLEPEAAQLIAEVAEGSEAAKAGVKKNDLLLSVGDEKVKDAASLAGLIAKNDGKTITLKLLRKGKNHQVDVDLPEKARVHEAVRKYYLGISVGEVGDEVREQLDLKEDKGGVVILDVVEGSPAAEAKLKKNDILLELAGKKVGTAEELVALVQENAEKPVVLKYLRGGEEKDVELIPRVRPDELTTTFNVPTQPGQEHQFRVYGPGVVVGPEAKAEWRQHMEQLLPLVPGQQGQPGAFWVQQQPPGDLAKKLEELTAAVKSLQKQIEDLKSDKEGKH